MWNASETYTAKMEINRIKADIGVVEAIGTPAEVATLQAQKALWETGLNLYGYKG